MAFTVSGSLAIDETSGTQNAASTSNVFADNDVTLAALSAPAGAQEFDLLLAQVAGLGVSPTGVSVSNADATHPTGTPLLTGLGAKVTNLAFTDSLGQPLDGDAAKFGGGATDFLMTADGYKIFLYSYSALVGLRTVNGPMPADLSGVDENNAVFGVKADVSGAGGAADPNGALVFAAYLQPTDAAGTVQATDVNAAGAKVWVVEYQAIQHGTAGSAAAAYDDARSLFDPLYVSVSNRTEFSLEGAPSGQNLFLMYADGTPAAGETAIVVTGKHPINQSIDSGGITSGDTVNTGQGGGGTTIGSNNQMIDPNEGMYFTFVKLSAASEPFTVPHLDQNEADLEANITFDSYLGQTEAIFTVVQLQPPKAATMLLTALNNADGTEKGADFIDGLSDGTAADLHGGVDDAQVNIFSVTISRAVKVGKTTTTYQLTYSENGPPASDPPGGPLGSIAVDFSGSTVKLTGVLSGDVIDYKTDGLHNRVLIDNAGNADARFNASFDIGGFSLINASTVPTPFQVLSFQDDGPTAAAALGASEVIVDETAGDQDNDVAGTTAFDPDGAGGNPATTLAALFAVTGAGADTNLPQYALSAGAVVASTGSSGGADGVKSTAFSLAIAGGADGTDSLLDTTDGRNILLFKEGDLIVGRYDTANGAVDASDPAAFAIAIDQGGQVAVAQYVSLRHPTAGDGATPPNSHDERIDLTGLVDAVVTVTDSDNDTASTTTAIGDRINFDDDGPSAGIALGTSEVIVDETAGIQDDDAAGTAAFDKEGDGSPVALSALFAVAGAGTDANLPQYALSGGAVVASTGSSGGTDGLKSTVLSLAIVGGNGTDSLLDTTEGKSIFLYKEGDLVVGRYDADGVGGTNEGAAFAIAIDQDGRLAVAQYVSLKHPASGDGATPANSYDERIDLTGVVNAVVTVTDNDNDTASTSAAVGDRINFDDDGPAVAFGNLIGTGSVNPQYGYWTSGAGTDGMAPSVAGLDINVTGFTLVRPDNTTAAGTATLDPLGGSPDGSGNFLFSGTLSGDFDNVPATTDPSIHYFLTALAGGTYKLDLVEGFVSTTSTVSTIDGLTAGGPDPVQTLTPGAGLHPPAPLTDKQIVFFNVLATDTESQVESLIGGNPDLTEAQIEANPSFAPLLGTEAMNVSTSGIGVGNNNLNGNDTSSSGLDESFVANPEFDVTKVKVFIDNSVSGYTPATESLLYTLYYTDGTTSGTPIKVLAGDIIAGAKGNDPVHFDVQAAAGKTIDAVQLTMDSGTIKIPYIEFVTEIAAPANDLQLAFQAILTDGDGDTASSSFVANLFANELAGSFNFVQTGTSGADAFNIDLLDPKNLYQANAFTPGVDKLVLLGANSYTIDNGGANSIVDVTEAAGTQHTLVTVVGVDLAPTDIATIV